MGETDIITPAPLYTTLGNMNPNEFSSFQSNEKVEKVSVEVA